MNDGGSEDSLLGTTRPSSSASIPSIHGAGIRASTRFAPFVAVLIGSTNSRFYARRAGCRRVPAAAPAALGRSDSPSLQSPSRSANPSIGIARRRTANPKDSPA